MTTTVENSPWHRETNTAVHTDMVVSEYLSRTDFVWQKDHLKGALACAFHDVGKPGAKTVHNTPERGEHFKFLEHELLSTRLFEDYVVRNWSSMSEVLVAQDIYDIGWIIQHHLPYKIKQVDKVASLVNTLHFVLPQCPEVFGTVLKSDQYGRISDDHQQKKDDTQAWIDQFYGYNTFLITPIKNVNKDRPTLTILVGASGSGKSTNVDSIQQIPFYSIPFSWDTWRLHDFPHPNQERTIGEAYEYAFNISCEDKQFFDRCLVRFVNMVKNKNNIVVDNMNLTEKSRKQFTAIASHHGYHIQYLMFPVSIEQLVQRGKLRSDRDIDCGAIINMFYRLTYPSISPRCHDVIVMDSNLIK